MKLPWASLSLNNDVGCQQGLMADMLIGCYNFEAPILFIGKQNLLLSLFPFPSNFNRNTIFTLHEVLLFNKRIVTFFIFSLSEIVANEVKETSVPFISPLNSEI